MRWLFLLHKTSRVIITLTYPCNRSILVGPNKKEQKGNLFMKNKKLLLLGTFALVFSSGLAAAGSTFAWYTTNRNASLNFNEAEIENLDSHLKLDYLGSHNTFKPDPSSTDNHYVFAGINRLTDVSGDGLHLYKPYWTSKNEVAREIIPLTVEAGGTKANGFYLDLFVKVSRTHEDGIDPTGALGSDPYGLKVYLGEGSGIKPKDAGNAKDVAAAQAARIAVIEYPDAVDNTDRGTGEVKWIHTPDATEVANHIHISKLDVADVTLVDTRNARLAELADLEDELAILEAELIDLNDAAPPDPIAVDAKQGEITAKKGEISTKQGEVDNAKAAITSDATNLTLRANADLDYSYDDGYILETTPLLSDKFMTHESWDEADAAREDHLVADLTDDGTDPITEAYIGFRIWIEGEDKETTREQSLGGKIKIDLKLYAIHDEFANLPDNDF